MKLPKTNSGGGGVRFDLKLLGGVGGGGVGGQGGCERRRIEVIVKMQKKSRLGGGGVAQGDVNEE